MTFRGLETPYQCSNIMFSIIVGTLLVYVEWYIVCELSKPCAICKHHNLWDTSTEGLLSFKQMVLPHIRYTCNVPSALAIRERVKVSDTQTHTLINKFGLFKWVYNIKTLSSLMQARNIFLHFRIMTPIKTNDKIAVWELQVWNPTFQWLYSHSQGLGFKTVFNKRCDSHIAAYRSSLNIICMND